MSWDQGITPREELPEKARRYLDGLGKGEVQYITWFGLKPTYFIADYGEAGAFKITIRKEDQ